MELNNDTKEKQISFRTFLRGTGIGELEGPYISQFLYLPFKYGNMVVHQKYFSEPDSPISVTKQGWLDIQNGIAMNPQKDPVEDNHPESMNSKTDPHEIPLDPQQQDNFKYCHTPRVLGSMVHSDPLYQFYYNAALVARQNGIEPQGFDGVADKARLRSSEWTSSGFPDILASVAHVALGALRVAWYHKYGVGMKIRPEVYAQRIQLAYEKEEDENFRKVPGLHGLKIKCDNHMKDLLHEVSEKNKQLLKEANKDANNEDDKEAEKRLMEEANNKNYYLCLQYPEGSPTHPSHPAGHAVVAGACCTILKAMFNCHDENGNQLPWPEGAKHSIDGDSLVDFGDAHKMTIVGEFNKLASNVSLGRDFAGVHYRCDGECGMKIGEQYAISYLKDKCKEYYESQSGLFNQFFLEKFDGEKVCISRDGVTSGSKRKSDDISSTN